MNTSVNSVGRSECYSDLICLWQLKNIKKKMMRLYWLFLSIKVLLIILILSSRCLRGRGEKINGEVWMVNYGEERVLDHILSTLKSTLSCLIHSKGIQEGFLLCHIYHKGILKGTFTVYQCLEVFGSSTTRKKKCKTYSCSRRSHMPNDKLPPVMSSSSWVALWVMYAAGKAVL